LNSGIVISGYEIRFGYCYGDRVKDNTKMVECVRSDKELQNVIIRTLNDNPRILAYPKSDPEKPVEEVNNIEFLNTQEIKNKWNNEIHILQYIPVNEVPEDIESQIENTLKSLLDIFVKTSSGSIDKKHDEKTNYWQIAPAENARLWDELRDQGIAAVGFSRLDFDLSGKSKEDLMELFAQRYPEFGPQKTKINFKQLWDFLSFKPGDKIVSNKGKKLLLGLGLVKEGGYKFRPDRKEYKHTVGVDYYKISEKGIPIPKYLSGKFGRTNLKLTKSEFETLEALFNDGDPEKKIYRKEDALKDLFVEEEEFNYMIERLKSKKNIILQGPPGVGKTFIAKRLAYYLIGSKDDNRVPMIQFHQSYSYEDFIQGFRPNDVGKFDLKNGIFYEFCNSAMEDGDNKYVFVIDEINRGNLSKIFGEMLMLIEADKRGSDFSVALTYGKDQNDKFYIPSNVYLIGTMNTADRSLAMVDYALRRRFSFINLKPEFISPKFKQFLKTFAVNDELISKIVGRMTGLNEKISEDTKNLGAGYQIGHSYFCPDNIEDSYDEDWYTSVIKSEIEPLLTEYWFDDPERVKKHINILLS
jgi:5-methylcytosine-specific restriction protein B